MIKVVFVRHGKSTWNVENRFTGWTDVDLAPEGVAEAREAGRLLEHFGYEFDLAFTSVLKRAIRTLWVVQDVIDAMWLPVGVDWRLNERHYGALQGLNKAETAAEYGAEQVHRWRRGYAIRPPELAETDPRVPWNDRRYAGVPRQRIPRSESLADTMERVLPCWNDAILPSIAAGKRVLVVAHGNSLRALIKHLQGISDEAIMGVEVPTGVPLVYEFDDQMQVLRHFYLQWPGRAASG